MLLDPKKSICLPNQTIIVSKDRKEPRQHRALNPNGSFSVRHYRLDGDLVVRQECCDFLLLNDTKLKAYYIELKGRHVDKAVSQLLSAEKICHSELSGYTSYYRIVASKSPTQKTFPKSYRDLLSRVGRERLICRTNSLEETLK